MNAPIPVSTASATPIDDLDAPSTGSSRRRWIVRSALAAATLVVLVGGATAGAHHWTVGRFEVSTDDAYVKADSTIVAPKVAGYVAQLLVGDNQPVRAGQLLARIDDRDFRTALDQASANVDAAKASVANLDAQITAQGSAIRQADAGVTASAASLGLARRNDQRRAEMAKVGYGSVEQADSASTDAAEQSATLERGRAAAVAARQQIAVLTSQRQLTLAQLAHAEAARRQAALNLSYTNIIAPVDGTVGARSLRAGQYVQAGNQLMAIVPLQRVYVIANFKETQLTHVVPGQPAHMRVDAFPDDDLRGRVDTLAPASGMEFSLLPPDNATGNFTKIVQRIPVKIAFPASGPLAGRLRPGMSVSVSIDTRPGAGANRAH
ncbi:MAG: secretion protein HlyD [Sphingomonas bacterium]|uniref:HlyD family secretion protein n=1 Tax=Sphingomonas bacterium TaxID=1895847 RepID=UPI002603A247|nr:HlyD family secretion protein [Sphingomonas bacterium]MDB5707245.1 secretion protein HlyD [Sphingomonas bacterium]